MTNTTVPNSVVSAVTGYALGLRQRYELTLGNLRRLGEQLADEQGRSTEVHSQWTEIVYWLDNNTEWRRTLPPENVRAVLGEASKEDRPPT